MENQLTSQQKELIERTGVFMEKSGKSPAQARIFALLLVCDKAELTFEDIYENLGISKSAASNAINALLLTEKIQYHTKPGDRKRYFSTRIIQIQEDFSKNFQNLLNIKELFKEILSVRSKETKEFNAKLKTVIDFMSFLEKELPHLFKKWKELNK